MSTVAAPWIDSLTTPRARRTACVTRVIAATLVSAACFGSTPALAGNGNRSASSDDLVVVPDISVVESVTPLSRQAPGGAFTYGVVVSNPGPVDIVITSLVDDVYGDLGDPANPDVSNNTCDDVIGDVLPATGGSTMCSFVGIFTGQAGDTLTDTVTVVGMDPNANTATDSDDAVATLVPAPDIEVAKSVTPSFRPEPGGQFTYILLVSNPGPIALAITTLVDNIYGNLGSPSNPDVTSNTCDDLIGDTLAAGGGSATCSFVGTFTGQAGDTETDIVTVIGTDPNGNTASDDDDAIVTLVPAAQIAIIKTATPATRPAPGGAFTFDLAVSNPGPIAVTITSLVDDVYGNLGNPSNPNVAANTCDDLIGDTLAAGGGSTTCSFVGTFTGVAGDQEIDTVTVVGQDTNGFTAIDNDDAVVSLTAAPASDGSVRGDFDGDGIGDLAIGAPGEDVGAVSDAGVAHVIYGSAGGLTATGSQYWSQNSAGVADTAEAGDEFGSALSAGDFNGDGRDDVAIGAPGEDVGSYTDGGVVHVLYGSAAGLTASGSQHWSQNAVGISDTIESGDHFGAALATGRLNTDGFAELVVGVPDEDIGTTVDAGVVQVIPGAASGLTATGEQYWHQNSAGVADAIETGDGFGAALAIGDLNSTAGQDLAIGAPAEDVGSTVDAGVVHVLYGSAGGATGTGSQYWEQDSPGLADAVEVGDRFGSALAAGSLDSDAFAELVVGVPDEDVGPYADAGVVQVLLGAAGGLTATGSQYWQQNSAGIADAVEPGDGFGGSLAIGAMNNVVGLDLAIGAASEDVGATVDAGVVHVIFGSAAGLTATGSQYWTQNAPGLADAVETGDRFGNALTAGKFNSDAFADLVVGVPDEDVGANVNAGVVQVLPGAASGPTATGSQYWTQNSAGIADSVEAGDGFGGALAG